MWERERLVAASDADVALEVPSEEIGSQSLMLGRVGRCGPCARSASSLGASPSCRPQPCRRLRQCPKTLTARTAASQDNLGGSTEDGRDTDGGSGYAPDPRIAELAAQLRHAGLGISALASSVCTIN